VPTIRPPRGPALLARVITEVLAPWVLVVVIPFAIAWQATHRPGPTLAWGAWVAATSSLIPMAVIVWGARRGRWEGHHVRDRAGRLVPFLALIGCTAVGVAVLVGAGAPRPVLALDLSMFASLLVTGAITIRWKISMHAAVAAGAVTVLAVTYGASYLLLVSLAAAIGWSRVRLADHSTAQVVVGLVVGALVGGGVYVLLR
jgi:membrane-associated phospholipid phosphatase